MSWENFPLGARRNSFYPVIIPDRSSETAAGAGPARRRCGAAAATEPSLCSRCGGSRGSPCSMLLRPHPAVPALHRILIGSWGCRPRPGVSGLSGLRTPLRAGAALPQKVVFPQAESSPSLGHGSACAGVDAVFVGRRDAERGAVRWGKPLCWPCRPASVLARTGASRGCACSSLAASTLEPVIFKRLGATHSKSLQNRICP